MWSQSKENAPFVDKTWNPEKKNSCKLTTPSLAADPPPGLQIWASAG